MTDPSHYKLNYAFFASNHNHNQELEYQLSNNNKSPSSCLHHENYHFNTLMIASSSQHNNSLFKINNSSSASPSPPFKSFQIHYRKKITSSGSGLGNSQQQQQQLFSLHEYTLQSSEDYLTWNSNQSSLLKQQQHLHLHTVNNLPSSPQTPNQHFQTSATSSNHTTPINNHHHSSCQSPTGSESAQNMSTSTSFTDFEELVHQQHPGMRGGVHNVHDILNTTPPSVGNDSILSDVGIGGGGVGEVIEFEDDVEFPDDLSSEDEDDVEFCIGRYIHFVNEDFKVKLLGNELELKRRFIEMLSLSYHVNVAQVYDLYLVIDQKDDELEPIITGLFYTMEYIPSEIKLNDLLKSPLSTDSAIYIFTQVLDVMMMFHSRNRTFSNFNLVKQLFENDIFIRDNLSSDVKKQIGIYLNLESFLECTNLDNTNLENEKLENIWNLGHLLFKLIVGNNSNSNSNSSTNILNSNSNNSTLNSPNLVMNSIDEEKSWSILEEHCSDRHIVDLLMSILTNDKNKRPRSVAEIKYSPWLMRFRKFKYFDEMKVKQQQIDQLNQQVEFSEKIKQNLNGLLGPLIQKHHEKGIVFSSSTNELVSSAISPRLSSASAGGNGNGGGGASGTGGGNGTTIQQQQQQQQRSQTIKSRRRSVKYMNGIQLVDDKSSSSLKKLPSKSNLMVGMFKKNMDQIVKPSHDPKENVNVDEYYQMIYKQQKQSFIFETGCKHNYFNLSNNQKTLQLLQNKVFGSDYYTARCEQKVTPLNNEIAFKIEKLSAENEIVIGLVSKDNDWRICKKGGILGSKKLQQSYGINFVSGQAGFMDSWKKFTKNKLLKEKATVIVNFNFDKRCLSVRLVMDDISTDLGSCFDDSIDLKVEWYFAVSLFKEKSAVSIVN